MELCKHPPDRNDPTIGRKHRSSKHIRFQLRKKRHKKAHNFICLLAGVPARAKLNRLWVFWALKGGKDLGCGASAQLSSLSLLLLRATAAAGAITNTTESVRQSPSSKEPGDDSAAQEGPSWFKGVQRHLSVILLQPFLTKIGQRWCRLRQGGRKFRREGRAGQTLTVAFLEITRPAPFDFIRIRGASQNLTTPVAQLQK